MKLITARPARGLAVVARGYGDDVRLARLLGDVFQGLPRSARRAMRKHWRTARPSPSAVAWLGIPPAGPRVELVPWWNPVHASLPVGDDDCALPYRIPVEHVPLGVVTQWGFMVRFRSDTFARMPDDVARTLIAHELAHVWQWADGQMPPDDEEYRTWEYDVCIESHVIEVLNWWGYDDDLIDDWWEATQTSPTPTKKAEPAPSM